MLQRNSEIYYGVSVPERGHHVPSDTLTRDDLISRHPCLEYVSTDVRQGKGISIGYGDAATSLPYTLHLPSHELITYMPLLTIW